MNLNERYTSYMYAYPHKTAYGTIDSDPARLKNMLFQEEFQLYLHIPFCETKCGYCNLFSVPGLTEADMERYLSAMEEQAEGFGLSRRRASFTGLTIGGGTPLLLSERLLERMFRLTADAGAADVSSCIETSPGQTTAAKVAILKKAGINRVSIGVQSFRQEELDEIGRRHCPEAAAAALSLLKDAQFDCLNVDLIYGMPSQTAASLRYSLDRAMEYRPDELFVYPLYIRSGTGLGDRSVTMHPQTGSFYWLIREYLLNHGYHQQSMRRFTLQQPEAATGCAFDNTLALGCGGRSYFGNVHFCTPYAVHRPDCLRLLERYLAAPDKCRFDYGYILNEDESRRRYIIKNLLHVDGLDLAEYREVFGGDPVQTYPVFAECFRRRFCNMAGGRIVLTPLGLSLSDYIGPMFISEDVMEKMRRWKPSTTEEY